MFFHNMHLMSPWLMEFLDSLWLLAIINSVLDSVMCVYIYIYLHVMDFFKEKFLEIAHFFIYHIFIHHVCVCVLSQSPAPTT